MAWLAVAVDWQGADRSDSVRALLRPEPWQEGTEYGRNSFASWGRARGAPDAQDGPYQDSDVALLFDGRLDNTQELAAALGGPPAASHGELLAGAYRRWGVELGNKLLGDFAIAVVDRVRRTVLALRDPSGVRPLAYHVDESGLTIASDPLQLLRLPRVSRALDEETIVEHLLRRGTSLERTFFRGIRRVPPGHRLIARVESVAIEPFFRPPPEDPRLNSPAVVLEELRHRLFASVRDRARGPQPVAAYLSGGIDSSVIVCAASALAHKGELPPLACTLSARYPGGANDEGAFMKLVTDRTGLRAIEWDATVQVDLPASVIDIPEPPFLTAPVGADSLEWPVVTENAIRVLLDGVGGDEVGAFPGVMEDLGRERRFGSGVARVFEPGIDRDLRVRRARALARGVASIGLPFIHRSSRTLRARLHQTPRWLSRQGRQLARSSVERGWTGGGPFVSAAQGWQWGRLTAPFFIGALERLHRRGVMMKVDRRYPFLDRRVVELILSLSVEYRLRYPYRRLHQTAMADVLPPEIAQRSTKANFDGSLIQRVRAAAPLIERTLAEGPWLSEPFVDRTRARLTARQVLANTDDFGSRAFEAVSKITALELWLRQLG
jgi:asparagine synthase (glutamine-hydrolysing)